MPAYAFLASTPLETDDLPSRMRVLRTLGAPYSDEDIATASTTVKGSTEMDAMIAYLQGLGTVLRNVR
jgi:cytochrome c oxidase cbb3-type subunit 2